MHVQDNFFSLGKSYTILEKEYAEARNNLLPHSYHFLITFGEVALQEGHIRRSIELTREALRYAHDPNSIAYVYLTLAQSYRMLIQMQNTRAELRRAFKVLEVVYPQDGVLPLLWSSRSLFSPLTFTKKRKSPVRTHESREREKITVSLYQEAALSTYYMMDSALLLLQISFLVRRTVIRLGPSMEMMNYLAATATMFAIYKQRFLAKMYLSMAKKVVVTVNEKSVTAEYLCWEILMVSYLDNAIKSSELTEKLLTHYKNDLSLHNLRLICTTLCTNYTFRGKTSLAIAAIDQMMTPYDHVCDKIFSCNKTFIEWYKIPSLMFHGEFTEASKIVKNSQAIFASVDQEKWQLTLFLGNMLMYYYISPHKDKAEIRNIFVRFNAIELSPRNTFLEAQHFWVAKAYLLLDLYLQEKHSEVSFWELYHAISDVKKNSNYRETRSHHLVLTAYFLIIRGLYGRARVYIKQAKIAANEADNDWASYEADKALMLLLCKENEHIQATALYHELSLSLIRRGWQGCIPAIDAMLHKYTSI